MIIHAKMKRAPYAPEIALAPSLTSVAPYLDGKSNITLVSGAPLYGFKDGELDSKLPRLHLGNSQHSLSSPPSCDKSRSHINSSFTTILYSFALPDNLYYQYKSTSINYSHQLKNYYNLIQKTISRLFKIVNVLQNPYLKIQLILAGSDHYALV